ncbi:MAG: amidohydrolase family protein [Bryobacteraceae bacterium]
MLDVAAQHPVLFDASYVVVVNSLGLKLAGITRNTPNPPGGEIVHDTKGEPNGILKNAESLLKGARKPPAYSEADRSRALYEMLQRYAEAGLTSVLDRLLVEDEIALYRKLKETRGLPLRVGMTFRPDGTAALDEVLRRIEQAPYSTQGGDDWLRFAAFKLTLDGGMTIGTAYQRQPYGSFGAQLYGKTDPADRGQLFIPRQN